MGVARVTMLRQFAASMVLTTNAASGSRMGQVEDSEIAEDSEGSEGWEMRWTRRKAGAWVEDLEDKACALCF